MACDLSLHVPFLRTDISRDYSELLKELACYFKQSPAPCVEIFTQGERYQEAQLQESANKFPLTSITLEELYQSELFGNSHAACALPNEVGVLCCNQILHRTPNPIDLLRPLIRTLHTDGYMIIIELAVTSHNPYPPKTPGVFSYGTEESKVKEYLDECYLDIITTLSTPACHAWVAQWSH